MLTPTRNCHKDEAIFRSDVWELLKRGLFYYQMVRDYLADAERLLRVISDIPSEPNDDVRFAATMLDSDAREMGLPRTKARIERLQKSWMPGEPTSLSKDEIAFEAKVLLQAFEDDLKDVSVFVPSPARAELYSESEESKMFGETVNKAFRSLRFDIREANNCYATDNYTACVFHLMRITEQALRLLAKKLRVQLKKQLDYADWIDIQKGINDKLKTVRSTPRGPKRDAEYEFYSDAADHCQHFKELWRDNVMHSRTRYDEPKAREIMTRVRGFLDSLALKIRE